LGMFASAMPFTIAGLGLVAQAWRIALIHLAGLPDTEAAATGFLLHGFQLLAAALYGLIGYLLIQFRAAPKAEESSPLSTEAVESTVG